MATDLKASPIRTSRADQFIERELGQTSSRLRTAEIAWAVLAAVAWSLALLLALVVVDAWMVNLGGQTRLFGLGVLVAGAILIFCYGALPALLRRINPQYVARMIEKSGSSFHNSLVNYLLVRNNPQKTRTMVYEAVSQRAANDLSSLDEDRRVDFSRAIRMGAIVAGLVALMVAYIIFSPRNPWTSMGRILAPGSRIAPASVVTVTNVLPGDATVYYGDRLRVTCDVRGRTGDQPVHLIFTSRDGQIRNATVLMAPVENGNVFNGEISCGNEGICTDLDYFVSCGDGRSPEYHIAVRANPTITVSQVEIVPPEYTRLPPSVQLGRGEIRAPEGSTVRISASSNQEMKLAWIELVRATQAGTVAANADNVEVVQSVSMEIVDARQSTGEFVLQLDADRKLQKYSHYRIRFRTMDDQRNELASLHPVLIIPDAAPEVTIVRPETTPTDLPLNSRITVEVHASDIDYEISKIELSMDHRGSSLLDRDVELPLEKNKQKVVSRYSLDPKALNLREGDEVVFYARASDNRISPYSYAPDPNVSITSSQTVRIVAADPNAKNASDTPNPAQANAGSKSETPDKTNPDKSQSGKPGEQSPAGPGGGSKSEQGGNKAEQSTGGAQPEKAESDAGGNKSEESDETGDAGEKSEGTGGQEGSKGAETGEQDQSGSDGEKQAGAESGGAASASGEKQGEQSETGSGESGNSAGKAGTEGTEQGKGAEPADNKSGGNQAASSDPNAASGSTESKGGKGAESTSDSQNPAGGDPGGNDSSGSAKNGEANGGEKAEAGNSERGSQDQTGQPSSENSGNKTPSGGSGGQRDESLRDGEVQPLSEKATDSDKFDAIQEFMEKNKGAGQSSDSSGDSAEQAGAAQSSESTSDDQAGKPDPNGNQSGNSKPGENPETDKPGDQDAGAAGDGKAGDNQSTGSNPGNQSGSNDSTSGDPKPGSQVTDKPSDKSSDPSGKSDSDSTASQTGVSGDEKSKDETGNETGNGDESGTGNQDEKTGSGSTGEPTTENPDKSNTGSGDEKGSPGTDAESKGADSQNNKQESGKPGEQPEKPNGGASKPGSPDSNQESTSESGQPNQGNDSSRNKPGSAGDPNGSSQQTSSTSDPSDKSGGTSSGTGAASRGGSGASGNGGAANNGNLVDPQTSMTRQESEQVEYNRAATDLVLSGLDDQKGQPSEELLKRLNMSEQDLKDFMDRWKKMREMANTGDPVAQKRYTEALRSLSLRSASMSPSAVKVESDGLSGMAEDGGVNRPSAELAPEFRAFMKARNRVESGDGGSK